MTADSQGDRKASDERQGNDPMRAVIYARYSSENQREASIEDQIRLCKERIAAEGWALVQVFRDAGMSGASPLRPGYQALLEGSRVACFDVVVAEALDRLSRDQEDVAAFSQADALRRHSDRYLGGG
jgi:DNA invertase Pin-like site-specific DNA recombinase